MEYQVCKVCLEKKELTKENFAQGKYKRNGYTKFYWYKTCKDCDRDRIANNNKKYKQKNRKKLANQQKEYHEKHKEQDSETKKKWYLKNKEKVKARIKRNVYKRRESDPLFRLKQSVSANIRQCIKKNHQPFAKYLDYTLEELKHHLESQFESWMNWSNYGVYRVDTWDDTDNSTWTWQIDHIIPHSSFNYSSMEDEQFKACWSLENLRPYSAKQNVVDGNRI